MLADEQGQILEAHSVSAGLDYPGVGPEHAQLRDSGRATYFAVTDAEALRAFRELSRLEGIVPALEPAHAIAWLLENGGRAAASTSSPSAAAATRTSPRRPRSSTSSTRSMADGVATGSGVARIADAFEAARAEGRAALMPYLMGGFPDQETATAVAEAYADSGADLIELGVPFSDPLADGPTIHAADTAALEAGATLESVLETCAAVSERLPVAVMIYANMLLGDAPGSASKLAEAGAAGAIVPDLPLEEAPPVREALNEHGLALVPLLAPTTPEERRRRICEAAQGFVYVVSTVGTTGEREDLPPELIEPGRGDQAGRRGPRRRRLRHLDPRAGRQVGEVADGVIIGSRLVREVADAPDRDAAVKAVSRLPPRHRRRPQPIASAPWPWPSSQSSAPPSWSPPTPSESPAPSA